MHAEHAEAVAHLGYIYGYTRTHGYRLYYTRLQARLVDADNAEAVAHELRRVQLRRCAHNGHDGARGDALRHGALAQLHQPRECGRPHGRGGVGVETVDELEQLEQTCSK